MHLLFTRKLWYEAMRLQHRQLLLWPALREVVGIVLVYLVVWSTLGPAAKPLALAAAAGALMAGMASVTGPSRTRGRILLGMTALLGLGVGLGLLVSEHALLAAGIVTLATFGLAMLAAANPLYQGIAVISVSYMVTYAGQEQSSAELWWAHGLAILVGGLLQMFFLTWMWPLRPFSPEREQIAQVYRDIASSVHEWPQRTRSGLMLHHSSELPQAQTVTVERYHPQWQPQQRELTWLLDRLYDLDAALTGYAATAVQWQTVPNNGSDNNEPSSEHPTPRTRWLMGQSERLADLLERLAQSIDSAPSAQGHLSDADWAEWQAALNDSPAELHAESSAVRMALCELRDGNTTPKPELSVEHGAAEPVWQELLRPWRDCHRVQFSAYYALSMGLMTYFSQMLPWENSSWLVMTYSLIFGSDYQRLLTKGLARVLGTLAALALILLIQQVTGMNEAVSTALFVLSSYLVVATVQAGYLAVTLAFTVYSFATMSRWEVNLALDDRLWLTFGGVVLATLAYQLWPNWHLRNLPERRETAVKHLKGFLSAQQTFIDQRPQADADTLLQLANTMRVKLLKMGRAFKEMAEVAAASRAEPAWQEQNKPQKPKTQARNPLEELEDLEQLAARSVGLYAALIADTVTPQQAQEQLSAITQYLSDLQLSEVPQPSTPLGRLVSFKASRP